MKNSTKNKKKIPIKQKLLILVFFVLGILFISTGIILNIKSNPKTIMKKSISELYLRINNAYKYKQDIIDINSNFMIDSSFEISSTYNQDDEYSKYFYDAINNTKNKIVYGQDLSNKKLLYKIHSNKNNNSFIYKNLFINNSTKYIKLDSNSQYINTGTNNIFELYNDSNINEKINYLLEFFSNSFIDNINDKDILVESTKTIIDNKQELVYKISFSINNDNLIKILNNVHNDIVNDEEANSIISNIDNNYKDKEIPVDEHLLRENTSINIIIYTDILYRTKKYEIIYQNDLYEKRIAYTPLEDYSIITISNGEEIEKIYKITGNKDKYEIDILNSKNKLIGNMTIENSKDRFTIISTSETDDNKVMLNLDRILSNIDKNSYNANLEIHYTNTNKITKKKELTLDIKGYTKVKRNVIIEESIDNSIIYDTLSSEDKENIDNYNKILLGKIIKMEDTNE